MKQLVLNAFADSATVKQQFARDQKVKRKIGVREQFL
jgi:hypothetical protein